ncbi:MAG: electron transfer flavoprotein subunit beta/FixA family protein [Desulfobacterales bacterium]|nr:electron transfer flavoprotein subunit beta/FixA family protein [Desulfobacterales bacterium]
MRIYVCVKHVPDTAANIKISGDTAYDPEVKYVPNPYDEFGIEAAVQITEAAGEGEVIAVCVGGDGAVNTLRAAMAMGAHRSILVKDPVQLSGSRRLAKALAEAIKADGTPDLVFTGKQSVDSEGMQTPYWLGAELGLPVAANINAFSLDNESAVLGRDLGGGTKETLTITLPCIIGATKGMNEPRFPKLPAILKAKKKPITEMEMDALVPEPAADLVLKTLTPVKDRSSATIIEGDAAQAVTRLVKILAEDAKVI